MPRLRYCTFGSKILARLKTRFYDNFSHGLSVAYRRTDVFFPSGDQVMITPGLE